MTTKKIGFACKLSELHPKKGVISVPECNTGGTTIAWLNRQSRDVAEQKLWSLMVQNIESVLQLVRKVGTFTDNLRMVRLTSDILPAYTESSWSYFWKRPDVREYAEKKFAEVGETARTLGVRLSFHPGQFCVLSSASEDIVANSIEEFEYHTDMARWMGYGKQFQDFKINVHISGRQGPDGIRKAYKKLSPEARNCITLENEEISYGLADCLQLSDIIPTVLDIHHNWIREGSYIQPSDDLVKRVVDSWRGVRPTMHYSVSREEYLTDHSKHELPSLSELMENGHKKQKLRAHSEYYHNLAVNKWALGFLDQLDIMCESKAKNLASFALFEQAKELKLV